MTTFLVLAKIDKDGLLQDIQYVKEGLYLTAFLFGPIWLIYKGLWKALAVYLFLMIFLHQMVVAEVLTENFADFTLITLSIILGFNADTLLTRKFLKAGYQIYDIIIASSVEEAELKHITLHYSSNDTR